jgi:hypothetical protein
MSEEWPSYFTGRREHIHALGVISLSYSAGALHDKSVYPLDQLARFLRRDHLERVCLVRGQKKFGRPDRDEYHPVWPGKVMDADRSVRGQETPSRRRSIEDTLSTESKARSSFTRVTDFPTRRSARSHPSALNAGAARGGEGHLGVAQRWSMNATNQRSIKEPQGLGQSVASLRAECLG